MAAAQSGLYGTPLSTRRRNGQADRPGCRGPCDDGRPTARARTLPNAPGATHSLGWRGVQDGPGGAPAPAYLREAVVRRPSSDAHPTSLRPHLRPRAGRIARAAAGGLRWRLGPADYEISAYDPGHDLEFQTVSGPVCDRTGATSSRLPLAGEHPRQRPTLDAQADGLRGLLMGSMVQRTMDAEVHALEHLKAVLERG